MLRKYFIILFITLLFGAKVLAQIDVDKVLSIGQNALYFEDYVVSIDYFNKVINARPWQAEAYFYRSVAKINLEDYIGAEKDATLSIERNPLLYRSYLVRGVANINLKDTTSAINDYKKGLELAPQDEGLRYNLALALYLKKDYDTSIATIEQIKKYKEPNNNIKKLKADILLAKGDTTKAIALNNEILANEPNFIPSLSLKAQMLIDKEDYKKAKKLIDSIIDIDNTLPELYINRAMISYNLNDYRSAMKDYNKSLELDANNIVALTNRALLLNKVGQYDKALEDWNKVVAFRPNDMIAIYNRAIMLSNLGNHRDAIIDINNVLQKYPGFIDAYYLRSKAYSDLGRRDLATKDLLYIHELNINKAKHKKLIQKSKQNTLRKDEDDDIEKYNQLLASNNSSEHKAKYSIDNSRGRIQDKNIIIDAIDMVSISAIKTDSLYSSRIYSSSIIDEYNKKSGFDIKFSIGLESISKEALDRLKKNVDSLRLSNDSSKYVELAVAHFLIKDYEKAIEYSDKSIANKDESVINFFILAMSYYHNLNKFYSNDIVKNENITLSNNAKTLIDKNKIIIDKAISNIEKAIKLKPKDPYLHYNLAYLFAKLQKNDKALEHYSISINLNNQFSEAYFNRALIHISNGNIKMGVEDLSIAGEGGIQSAYNIIKRIRKK